VDSVQICLVGFVDGVHIQEAATLHEHTYNLSAHHAISLVQ
jgi:hypothetical protein